MFLFLRLVLAHLLADFVFQFPDVIYKSKFKVSYHGFTPIWHGLIVGGTAFLLGWPYYNNLFFWGFVLYLTVSHHVVDQIKILLEKKSPALNTLLGFFADQCVHIVLLLPMFLIDQDVAENVAEIVSRRISRIAQLFSIFAIEPLNVPPPDLFFQKIGSALQGPVLPYLIGLYTNDLVVFFAMGWIAGTLGGTIVIYYLRKTLSPQGPNVEITRMDKYFGPMERTVIFILAFMTGQYILGFGVASDSHMPMALLFFIWIPIIGLLRWAVVSRREAHRDTGGLQTSVLIDTVSSVAWATFVGLVVPCLYLLIL